MGDYTAKCIGDMEAGFGGGFVKARAELGVSAFGMQVIQMPPNYADYPEHDHADSGQEEVFLALKGSGWMDIEGERVDRDGVGAGGARGGLDRERDPLLVRGLEEQLEQRRVERRAATEHGTRAKRVLAALLHVDPGGVGRVRDVHHDRRVRGQRERARA